MFWSSRWVGWPEIGPGSSSWGCPIMAAVALPGSSPDLCVPRPLFLIWHMLGEPVVCWPQSVQQQHSFFSTRLGCMAVDWIGCGWPWVGLICKSYALQSGSRTQLHVILGTPVKDTQQMRDEQPSSICMNFTKLVIHSLRNFLNLIKRLFYTQICKALIPPAHCLGEISPYMKIQTVSFFFQSETLQGLSLLVYYAFCIFAHFSLVLH